MHQEQLVGKTHIDNANPSNLYNKPYVALDVQAITGLGGRGGNMTATELAAQSNTGIDRANDPLAGIMSTESVDDVRLYGMQVAADTNSSFAAFQKRQHTDWDTPYQLPTEKEAHSLLNEDAPYIEGSDYVATLQERYKVKK